jgi:hypothetical protein
MLIWWALLMSLSRIDSATTGLGKSGYQSSGLRFEVWCTPLIPELVWLVRQRCCGSGLGVLG